MESDPIGLNGLISSAQKTARINQALATGDATPPANIPISFTPNLYTYADGNPLSETDPRGQFGIAGPVAVGVGVVAGLIIYATYKCVQKCDNPNVCPYPRDSGDPIVDQNRNAWVTRCKNKCAGAFGELAKVGPW